MQQDARLSAIEYDEPMLVTNVQVYVMFRCRVSARENRKAVEDLAKQYAALHMLLRTDGAQKS